MSNENLYEYIQGEYQDVTRATMLPAGTNPVFIRDENRVKMAGYDIELWDEKTGGVQLVLDTDYQLSYLDATISGIEGVSVYGGYTIITPAYQDVDLYLTAKIVGGYTARPYRPTYSAVTTDTTTAPSSVDDSIFVDTTVGPVAITLGDGEYVNQRYSVICSGANSVSIEGSGLETQSYINQAVQYVWNGTGWLNLGGAGSGGGSSSGNLGIGQVAWFAGSGPIPSDKLLCDGAEYNIIDYPGLFGSIGTTWGGDGVTTFAVPNLQGIHPGAIGTQDINGNTKGFPGANVGDYIEDQLQGHWHETEDIGSSTADGTSLSSWRRASANSSGYAAKDIITDGVNGDPRTGEFTDVSQAMGRWIIQAFDTVQEVPADPGLIKDYNLVWEGTPSATVPNAWGGGLFFIGYSYNYLGAEVLSNAFMGVAIDGKDREIVIDVDQTGGDSEVRARYVFGTNSFDVITSGTDFTNPEIRAIFKWGDVATGELNPPVDGWETVFDDDTNTGPVINAWGNGTYEFDVWNTALSLYTTIPMTLFSLQDNNSTTGRNTIGSNESYRVRYRNATNEFDVEESVSGDIYVHRIRKFNSLVNVVHSYAYAIGATYQQLAGEESPADMNMLGTWEDDSASHPEITWATVWKRTS